MRGRERGDEEMHQRTGKESRDFGKEVGRKKGGGEEGGRRVEHKVREVEKRLERKEREDRRRNFIIRGIVVKEGKIREVVEEVVKAIGANADLEGVKKMRGARKRQGR